MKSWVVLQQQYNTDLTRIDLVAVGLLLVIICSEKDELPPRPPALSGAGLDFRPAQQVCISFRTGLCHYDSTQLLPS